MNTNVKILGKDIETYNEGKTTFCAIRAQINIPSSLIALASTLPGWEKFMNAQTRVEHAYIEKLGEEGTHIIVLRGIAYAHKHKNDAMNPKLGEHFATTKAQINLFRLAINFQKNLKNFINRNLCGELSSGIIGCTQAKASCQKHVNNNLKKHCL